MVIPLYWQIAIFFFLVTFFSCSYSMWMHERDISAFHGMIERAGVCFVVAVAWPLSLIAIIAAAVSEVISGRE